MSTDDRIAVLEREIESLKEQVRRVSAALAAIEKAGIVTKANFHAVYRDMEERNL